MSTTNGSSGDAATGACFDVRGSLVSFAHGELSGLAAERIAAHLKNCAACRAVRDDVVTGIEAARAVAPVTAAELAGLQRRVAAVAAARGADAPDADAHEPATLGLGLGAGLGVGVGLGVGLGLGRRLGRLGVGVGVAGVAAAIVMALVVRPPEAPDVGAGNTPENGAARGKTRLAPTPEVRIVHAGSFAGDVRREGDLVIVEQRAGAAAYAFKRSAANKLEVRTPAGTIEVVGTQFAVDVKADGRVVVAVRAGVVRVNGKDGANHAVSAGDRLALAADGRTLEDTDDTDDTDERELDELDALLADEELSAFHASIEPVEPVAPVESVERVEPEPVELVEPVELIQDAIEVASSEERSARDRAPRDRGERPNVADVITEADQVARAGQATQARAKLAAALRDPAYARAADVLMYEIARLDGLTLDAPEKARTALQGLVKRGRPSLRVQAALTICEIDLDRDRCAARACLERARAERGLLGEEAARLEQRWSLRDVKCP